MMHHTEASSGKSEQQLLKGFMTCIKDNIYTDKEVVKNSWAHIRDETTNININELIDFQIDENDRFAYYCNSLHVAVSVNNSAAVKALLKLGANPNYPDSKERRGRYVPLRIALDKEHFETASTLIDGGASPNSRSMYGSGQQMTLIDRETKKDLNKKYGSEYVTNEEQLHPTLLLHYVESNKKEQAIFLIENNADLNPQIPLATLRAMMSGIKSWQQIDENFLNAYANEHCPSLILEAYEKQMYSVVKAVLEKDGKLVNDKYPSQHGFAGNTMLHRAAIENNLKMVETLLQFGANSNEANKEHETPLILVASRKKFDGDTLQIARLLILQSVLQKPNVDETLAITNPPNKTLISKINKMLYVTACLQSAFRYAANIDKKLDTYSIDKGNILQALINSKLNWLGNVVAINNQQDSNTMKGARVAYANVFKEIIQKLDGIYRIFDGTQNDDPFLFTELLKNFLAEQDENSIGYQFLVHKIQSWYPKNRYPNLYPKLPDFQEADQHKALEGNTSASSSADTDSQPLPEDQEVTTASQNGEQSTTKVLKQLVPPVLSLPPQKSSPNTPPVLPLPARNSTQTSTDGDQQPPEESKEPTPSVSTIPKSSQPNTLVPPLPPSSLRNSTPSTNDAATSVNSALSSEETSRPIQQSSDKIALLKAIQALGNSPVQELKHVKTDNRNGQSENTLQFAIKNAVTQRRKSMKPGEKQDTEPKEEGDKEWSDNEGNGNSPSPGPSP